ncbi:MAG: hypothetical protein R3F43_04920 [bacterium]
MRASRGAVTACWTCRRGLRRRQHRAGDGCDAACAVEAEAGAGTVCWRRRGLRRRERGGGAMAARPTAVEPRCGDGTLDAGEAACDDGNAEAVATSPRARLHGGAAAPGCGDGVLDAGEGCDDGTWRRATAARPTARVEPRCGDGALDAGEGCDDGNAEAGTDGCAPRLHGGAAEK